MKYWNSKGNEEAKNNILRSLTADIWGAFGEKGMKRSKNKHLERLRKAKYVYRRFYNDGDYNEKQFVAYFDCDTFGKAHENEGARLDDGMDKLILAAYAEQEALGNC